MHKSSGTISHSILIYPNWWHLHKWSIKWVGNCLNCQAQRTVNSGTKSNWCLVTSDVSQESIVFMLLFWTQMAQVSKLADGTKLVIWGGWNTGGQGCYSDGPGQHEEMVWQGSHEVQQKGQWNPVSCTCIYPHNTTGQVVRGELPEKWSGAPDDKIVPLCQRRLVAYWHTGLH